MKVNLKLMIICLISGLFSISVFADAPNPPAPAVTTVPPKPISASYTALTFVQLVQKKYNLSEAQMKSLSDAKLNENELVRVAHFAQLSNKSIDEIIKLRAETKGYAWGKIAKQLGIDPKEIGQAVAAIRHDRNEERKKQSEDKMRINKEKREEAKLQRERAREQRKENRSRPTGAGKGANK